MCVSRGIVRAGEGHTLRKEELCWRSFGGRGVGGTGEAAGHR